MNEYDFRRATVPELISYSDLPTSKITAMRLASKILKLVPLRRLRSQAIRPTELQHLLHLVLLRSADLHPAT